MRTRSGKFRPGSVILEVDGRCLEIHTVYGVATILRRSGARVQQLLEAGRLQGHRVGRDWLVLDTDLQHFIRQERARVQERFAPFLDK